MNSTEILAAAAACLTAGALLYLLVVGDWPTAWLRRVPDLTVVTFPPDTPSSYLRDLGPEPTDALFDTTPGFLRRHPAGLDPRDERDFFAFHAAVAVQFKYPQSAYEYAKQAAHFAFQLRPDLKAPLIEHARVPVVPFRRPGPCPSTTTQKARVH